MFIVIKITAKGEKQGDKGQGKIVKTLTGTKNTPGPKVIKL